MAEYYDIIYGKSGESAFRKEGIDFFAVEENLFRELFVSLGLTTRCILLAHYKLRRQKRHRARAVER